MFAFFLESTFLGLFLYGEKRLGPRVHCRSAVMVLLGSWLSGYFIIATNAWMQHPVGYRSAPDGSVHLASFWALLFNPWAIWQYAHNMTGAVVTASFVMAAVGAFYLLSGQHDEHGEALRCATGVIAGVVASRPAWRFPTGDGQGKHARASPAGHAGRDGGALRDAGRGAELVDHRPAGRGEAQARQPDCGAEDAELPDLPALERARSQGLDAVPRRQLAGQHPAALLRYHIMVGLGTLFIAAHGGSPPC